MKKQIVGCVVFVVGFCILFGFDGRILLAICKLPHYCLFQEVLSIPCPGCGTLQSILYLGRFELYKSIESNPAGILMVLYMVFSIVKTIIDMYWGKMSQFYGRLDIKLNYLFILLVLVNWFLKM